MQTNGSSISPEFLPLPEAGDAARPLTDTEKRLQDLLLEGLESGEDGVMDDAYFDSLHEQVRAICRSNA